MQRPCNGYITDVAAGQSQRFYSGVGIAKWHYPSSNPQGTSMSRGLPWNIHCVNATGILCVYRVPGMSVPLIQMGAFYTSATAIKVRPLVILYIFL